ncbi:MAG: aminotransferase class V-fold PLP-dependent enzyme [SAR202 cluster bacterium]|nr:aminotransferase class V-fold PLP-dependent enzyme [SAR202 cluster bacterium]OUU77955.1 MAG: serine--glyoxylate aminotransferase [Chloroflexi bacterium TMED70]RZP17649.1 MAG: aminotransferase class V-fold PLP-dependent enzyme [Chloroflexota bacterium]|tara:strand:+ start:6390 stop:7556 length:1167 start_codon:yes stop_codon:yes gene_type:complete
MTQNGKHFLQIPGPTNVPDSVLRAISYPTIDHRGPEFSEMTKNIIEGLKDVVKGRESTPIIFPSSGTGAWEASLVNILSEGDRILMFETGHFSTLWKTMAEKLGFNVEYIGGDWRSGVDAEKIADVIKKDKDHDIKAICMVHNETSTGVTSKIPSIIKIIKSLRHPAIIMVDTISSLGSIDYSHDDWNVDVTVAGSQKGLMLPPGIAFNFVSEKAIEISKSNNYKRSFWDWNEMITNNINGFFPYTPSTNILFGLEEALKLLKKEGLENVFRRHERHANATRLAVKNWGLELLPLNEDEHSNSLTSILFKEGVNADFIRKIILEKFNTSLGTGLGKWSGRIIRIGHLGDFNDPMLLGTLSSVEMGLSLGEIDHNSEGVKAAMNYLEKN